MRGHSTAVICVTHDSEAVVHGFAAATLAALEEHPARVVVVDSGSTDATVRTVGALLPSADVVVLDDNRGYAAGINVGVRHVRRTGGADVFVVANPDVRMRPGSLGVLTAAASRPGVGLAVPQLRSERDELFPSLRREPTVLRAWTEALFGGPRAHRLHLPTEVVWDEESYDHDRAAAWATGGLMAITDECLRRVGPWDETYFLYEEEVDFALRAHDAGFGLVYASRAVATRILGDGPPAPWAQALMHVNRVRLIRRRSRARAAGIRAALLVGDGMRTAAGRPEAAAAVWAVRRMAAPDAVMARFGPGP